MNEHLYDGRFVVVSFMSHRARDNAMRLLKRKPTFLYSWDRGRSGKGYAAILPIELKRVRSIGPRTTMRFTVLRGPYDDLAPCWS